MDRPDLADRVSDAPRHRRPGLLRRAPEATTATAEADGLGEGAHEPIELFTPSISPVPERNASLDPLPRSALTMRSL